MLQCFSAEKKTSESKKKFICNLVHINQNLFKSIEQLYFNNEAK